ncbi:family 78 glycoside hydrolase catalytic domain [Chondrinema litorale]|uniref:family 78 glycoside hydrolase catalytic domain n=1 Tax=Chondrinema litorale TaxID=2994555 RepID=UPI00254380F4|nr:family 78 glycoside hydrolase catalytic domain [Chondrinema litorale]UZR97700.1 family 78 glycoside hydrolase catalytic domain [Chondrinema litorale]
MQSLKTYKPALLFLIFVFYYSSSSLFAQQSESAFIWKNETGEGRQQVVFFRNSFNLENPPKNAWISLFADSRYHLYINGTFVNFGPLRFELTEPVYDSLNITNYLKAGKNTIAVKALSNGVLTFQVPLSIGGFKAWGEVDTGKNKIDLSTPGDWKMLPSKGFDEDALQLSFACGPMEIYDSRKDPVEWNKTDFDDSKWYKPLVVSKQDHWGKLAPRAMPFLTNDKRVPFKLLGAYPLKNDEAFYTFRKVTPLKETENQYRSSYRFFAYTYIYSDKAQEVEVGLHWGSHFLNGKVLEAAENQDNSINRVRKNFVLKLNQGWNYFFADLNTLWGGWEFNLAIPKDASLIVSANKQKEDSDIIFKSTKLMFNKAQEDEMKKAEEIAAKLKEDKDLSAFEWIDHKANELTNSAPREMVWQQPALDKRIDTLDENFKDIAITEPTAFVLDMGGKTLGRIFADIDAPEGTVIDIGWAEVLNDSGLAWIYKNYIISTGTRFITSSNKQHYETFKPYGFRYLQIHITPPKGEKAQLLNAGSFDQMYPFELQGAFESSDPLLNKIWNLGWRTLRVCAEDSYTDTPFRERGHYAGDALPEFATTLATSGDTRLMKRSIELFTQMYHKDMWEGPQNRHNDFPLILLVTLKWYTDYTGDLSLVKKYYEDYKSLMNQILAKKEQAGYINLERVFYEWTAVDRFDDLTGIQALISRALNDVACFADVLGKPNDAKFFREEADKLDKVITEKFWDEEKNAFFDGFHEGVKVDHYYPTSNALPVIYDVASDLQAEKVMQFLETELEDIGEEYHKRKTTPYGSFYVLSALYKEGRADIAEKFIKKYWARMIYKGDDTAWEHFDLVGPDGAEGGTGSHAWSSHPTFFLSTEALGVQLGYYQQFERETIHINPQSELLTWAKGTVPHPLGLVHVDWKISGDLLIMNVKVPEGVPYKVEPKGKLATYKLVLNGDLVN